MSSASVLGQEEYSSGGIFSFLLTIEGCQDDWFRYRCIRARADTHRACTHTGWGKGTGILLSKNDLFSYWPKGDFRGCYFHADTFTLSPFPSPQSDLLENSRADMGESCCRDRMGFQSGQGSCTPCTNPLPSNCHLISAHKRWSLQSLYPVSSSPKATSFSTP